MNNKCAEAITAETITTEDILNIARKSYGEDFRINPENILKIIDKAASDFNVNGKDVFDSFSVATHFAEHIRKVAKWLDKNQYVYTAKDLRILVSCFDENYDDDLSFNRVMRMAISDTRRAKDIEKKMSVLYNTENVTEKRQERARKS